MWIFCTEGQTRYVSATLKLLAFGVSLFPAYVSAQELTRQEQSAAADGEILDDGGALTGGTWSTRITVEGMVLQRDEATSRPLTKAGDTSAPIDPFVPFNSSALDFDATAGLRATVETEISGIPVELSGFYLSPSQGRASIENLNTGSNNTDAIYTNRDFPNGSTFFEDSEDIYGMIIEQQTDLMGAELNLRDVFSIPGLMIGARTIYLSEKFSSSTHQASNDFPLGGNEPADDDIDGLSIRSDNILAGVQIGYQGMTEVLPGISIGGNAKAGIYANFVNVESTFTSLSPRAIIPSRSRVLKDADDVTASTVFELNPKLDWRITDGMVVTAGGTFLWINNVSEAVTYYADAASAARYTVTDDGNAFFYGATLGVRFEMDKLHLGESTPASSFKDSGISTASVADVEDKIAQLEASAARSGNKAVGISVYGQVNKMLMWWNDGEQDDVYVVDNATSGTRFGIEGEGRINRALKAGFTTELRVNDTRSINVDQGDDDGEEILETRFAELWLQHNLYGRLTIGQTSPATDDAILADLGGVSGVASADIALIGGAMRLRRRDRPFENVEDSFESTLGNTMRGFVRDLDTSRRDGIRYDTDRYYGFVASAFWGENDFWDVGLTYARSWSDWRVRFRIGYLEDSDDDGEPGSTLITELKGSAAVLHNPTGLFLNTAFVHRAFDGTSSQVSSSDFTRGSVTVEGENFADFNYNYFQGGIRRQWTELGETSVFGEYAIARDALTGRGSGSGSTTAGFDRVTDSEMTMIGAGIVQKIDSANMDIYAGFRHFEYDVDGIEGGSSTVGTIPPDAEAFEDLSIVYTGTRIKF